MLRSGFRDVSLENPGSGLSRIPHPVLQCCRCAIRAARGCSRIASYRRLAERPRTNNNARDWSSRPETMRLSRENSLMYSSKGPFWVRENNWSRLSSSAPNGPNDSSSAVFKEVQSANFLPDSKHDIHQSKAFPPKIRGSVVNFVVFLDNSVCPKSQFHGKCPFLKVIRATSKGFRLSYPWTSVTWAVWIRERGVSSNRACLANIPVQKKEGQQKNCISQNSMRNNEPRRALVSNEIAEQKNCTSQNSRNDPNHPRSATSCNRRETWVEEYYVLYKECIEKRVTYWNEVRNGVPADTET